MCIYLYIYIYIYIYLYIYIYIYEKQYLDIIYIYRDTGSGRSSISGCSNKGTFSARGDDSARWRKRICSLVRTARTEYVLMFGDLEHVQKVTETSSTHRRNIRKISPMTKMSPNHSHQHIDKSSPTLNQFITRHSNVSSHNQNIATSELR